MKVLALIACFALLTFSCKHANRLFKGKSSSTIFLHEGQWISNFKNEVFIRCLKNIYPLEIAKMLKDVDASSAANLEQLHFNTQVVAIADSLAISFAKSREASWTIENRKTTLNVCIEYRNSRALDSIALLLFKQYK